MINWEKIDHFTGEPYRKNAKSGGWNIVDYISGNLKITMMPNGDRAVHRGAEHIGTFKTLKAAKQCAETIAE